MTPRATPRPRVDWLGGRGSSRRPTWVMRIHRRRLLWSAAIGAAGSILVSWACALWAPYHSIIEVVEEPGIWRGPVPAGWPSEPHAVWGTLPTPAIDFYKAVWWEPLPDPPATPSGRWQLAVEAGFPFRSFSTSSTGSTLPSDATQPPSEERTWSAGFNAPRWLAPAPGPARVIPLRPLWLGAALNALLFSASVYGLATGWRLVRPERPRDGRPRTSC